MNQEQKREEKCCNKCWVDKILNVGLEETYSPVSEPFCCNDSCPCHNKPSPSQQKWEIDIIVSKNY